MADSRTPTPQSSASSQPERPTLPPASTLTQHADAQESQQVAQRSRWQTVFLEAGGIGAALSEESMRRLKYCLQWLQVCILDHSWDRLGMLTLWTSYSTLRPRSTPRSSSSETSSPPSSPTAPYHTVSPSHHSIYTPCRQRSVTFWILSDRSWTSSAGMPVVHFQNQHDPAFDHSSFACRGNGQRLQGQV